LHSQDEFASLVDRALDAEPAKAPSSPKPQENRKPGNAPSGRAFAPKGKNRKEPIAGTISGDVDGCEAAPSTGSIVNEEIQGNAGSRNRTTATASSSDAEQAGEPVDESAPEAEPKAGLTSANDALAPNIIILPPPSVVIPFPVALAVEGGGSTVVMEDSVGLAIDPSESRRATLEQSAPSHTNEGKIVPLSAEPATSRLPAAEDAKEGGIDLTRLQMLPEETDEPHADNIRVIDFRQPAEAKIIRLPLAAAAALSMEHGTRNTESPDSTPPHALASPDVSEETALSQLPGDEGPPEEFAQIPPVDGLAGRSSDSPRAVTKAIVHAGLPRVQVPAARSAEATGISAARQESRMDSMKNSGQGNAFAGRGQNGPDEFPPASHESARAEVRISEISSRISGAMDWQLGRPVGSFDRPTPPSPVPLTPEQSATVDRISNLLLRETSLVRQYSSDSMAVVLRPDDNTELYVHFAQRNGQIEATIRCDRGDAHQLGALWPQLQESLAQQRVRLAPLQEGPSANSNFNHSTGFSSSGEGSGSQRHSPSDRQSMDERSAPASSIPDVSHVRERGGSRRRLTTSRPGWETWA
jgi:hypothetical protein